MTAIVPKQSMLGIPQNALPNFANGVAPPLLPLDLLPLTWPALAMTLPT